MSQARTGTRWGRTGILLAGSFAVLVGLVVAMSRQVIATSIVFQNSTAQMSTSSLHGTDVGFAMTQVTTSSGTPYVLRGGFADGSLDGLCISQQQVLPLVGTVTLVMTSGDGTTGTYDVRGRNAMFDIVSIRGVSGTNGNGINLDGRAQFGIASSDITTTATSGVPDVNPLGAPTGAGWWGIDADEGRLYNLRGRIYDGIIGGPFSLPGLKFTVRPGSAGCDAQALPR